jgi:hypothetical protein
MIAAGVDGPRRDATATPWTGATWRQAFPEFVAVSLRIFFMFGD